MTNSCISIKSDTIGLQPVFPSKALEMIIKILLNPGRVVFQDRHLSRNLKVVVFFFFGGGEEIIAISLKIPKDILYYEA